MGNEIEKVPLSLGEDYAAKYKELSKRL